MLAAKTVNSSEIYSAVCSVEHSDRLHQGGDVPELGCQRWNVGSPYPSSLQQNYQIRHTSPVSTSQCHREAGAVSLPANWISFSVGLCQV